MKAFVLHSGGVDSSAALLRAVYDGHQVISVGVDYGQRHKKEMDYAAQFANHYGCQRVMLTIENMPRSMLTDDSIEIPKVGYGDLPTGVSPTYVPFRNGQLIAKAAALASAGGDPSVIYMGMHAEDAERDAYPDCTQHFIGAMAAAVYIGTYHKVRLNAPFLSMYKHEIIQWASGNPSFGYSVPWYMTWSCYAGGEYHCGLCPTCRARKDAFNKASVADPTVYADDLVYTSADDGRRTPFTPERPVAAPPVQIDVDHDDIPF